MDFTIVEQEEWKLREGESILRQVLDAQAKIASMGITLELLVFSERYWMEIVREFEDMSVVKDDRCAGTDRVLGIEVVHGDAGLIAAVMLAMMRFSGVSEKYEILSVDRVRKRIEEDGVEVMGLKNDGMWVAYCSK